MSSKSFNESFAFLGNKLVSICCATYLLYASAAPSGGLIRMVARYVPLSLLLPNTGGQVALGKTVDIWNGSGEVAHRPQDLFRTNIYLAATIHMALSPMSRMPFLT